MLINENYMKIHKKAFADLISLLEGLSLGLACYKSIYLIDEIRVSDFKTSTMTSSVPMMLILMTGAPLLVFFLKRKLRNSYEAENLLYPEMNSELALLPLLLAAPLFLIPCGTYTPLLFILSVSISIFRYICLFPKSFQINFNLKILIYSVILFFLASVIYETLIQQKALDSFLLGYSDWGIYTNVVDNTIKGKFFYSNELGQNYLGHHFMPGAFLLMMPFVALFRSPISIFVLNSLILYAGTFIIYALALKKDIPKNYALILAVIYCLCPSLSNMTLSLFYGFHPVYITMPLIALFFLFYERKNFTAAFLIFIFSLTVKETVAIFWIGTGAMIFIRGNKKTGSFLVSASIVYFLFITLLIMPAISGKENYEFVSRFNNLGNSFSEIAFSPFTKTYIFLTTLLRQQNIFYLFVIIIPVFMMALNSSLVLGGSLIMFFSMLQVSDQVCHLGTQYQSEALMLLYISSVYGFSSCLQTSKTAPLLRFFLLGIKHNNPFFKNLPAALIVSVLFSSVISFCFFGKSFFSKNSDMLHWLIPRYTQEIKSIRKIIPEEASLTATSEFGAHFLFRNDVFLDYNRPLKDFILINLNDKFTATQSLENLREEVIRSGKYKLLKNLIIGNSIVLLYGKKADGEQYKFPKPGIIQIPLEKWKESSSLSTSQIPEVDYNAFVTSSPKSNKTLNLIFRIMKKIDFDFDIEIYEVKDSKKEKLLGQYSFGEGIFPAYMAETGEGYVIKHPLTENFKERIAITIIPKPKPTKKHRSSVTF